VDRNVRGLMACCPQNYHGSGDNTWERYDVLPPRLDITWRQIVIFFGSLETRYWPRFQRSKHAIRKSEWALQSLWAPQGRSLPMEGKETRQAMYVKHKVRRVRVTIFAFEKQYVLHIPSVYLQP